MELQLVQKLVPLPDERICRKVINAFNPSDYERNYNLLTQWFEEEVQSDCNENYQNQIHVILRGAKNDLERAKKRLRNFFLNKERGRFPELYNYYDLQGKYLEYKNFYCLCQPGMTSDGYRITCMGFTTPKMDNFDVDIMFKSVFMTDHLGMCLAHPFFLGIITIIDCQHVTTKHALKTLCWTFRKYSKAQNEIMPYRLVKLYMINVPRYIEKFVMIGKAFVGEKLRSRFSIEQSDEEMRRQIPKSVLPADYGGDGESLSMQCEKWFALLRELRPWYEVERSVRLRPQTARTDRDPSAPGAEHATITTPRTSATDPIGKRANEMLAKTCTEVRELEDEEELPLIENKIAAKHKKNKNGKKFSQKNCRNGDIGRSDCKLDQNDDIVLNFKFNCLEID